MKLSTTALATSLAGVTTAQSKPAYAPVEIVRADWYDCWDLTKANINIGVDSFAVKVPSWYYNLRDAPAQKLDSQGNAQASYCQGGLTLENKRGSPGNWKFRVKDYTFTGSGKTAGNATMDMFRAQLYMDYWTSEQTNFQLIRKTGRTKYLSNIVARDTIGQSGDFNSKVTVTKANEIGIPEPPQDTWSPCFGYTTKSQGSRERETFDLWFYTDMSPSPYEPQNHPETYDMTLGAPDGKSDIEFRFGLEFAECDLAKEPNSAWGKAYGVQPTV